MFQILFLQLVLLFVRHELLASLVPSCMFDPLNNIKAKAGSNIQTLRAHFCSNFERICIHQFENVLTIVENVCPVTKIEFPNFFIVCFDNN